jgi:hypothetical protein
MSRFFDEDGWQYQRIESQPALMMGFRGSRRRWRCVAQAREEQQQFVFYSILDQAVGEDQRARVAEFLTRANYGMVIGNFEMDYTDGEVRFKTSVDGAPGKGGLSPESIGHHVYVNVLMMDRYLGALESVLGGEATPEDAVASVRE